jgi:hypothetical protein
LGDAAATRPQRQRLAMLKRRINRWLLLLQVQPHGHQLEGQMRAVPAATPLFCSDVIASVHIT